MRIIAKSMIGALACAVLFAGCAKAQSTTGDSTTQQAAPQPFPRPAIVSAAEWGSKPQPIADDRKQVVRFLTVHHAGELWKEGDEPVRKLRGLQKYGQEQKNWPDLPYHLLIAPDGRIFEGRSMDYEPETNTDYDTNGHVGVLLWGNFEEQRVSREQLVALVDTLAWLSDKYGVAPADIRGHKDRAETLCPGRDFYRYITDGDIACWVTERKAGKTPDISIKPPLPEGPTVEIPKPAPATSSAS